MNQNFPVECSQLFTSTIFGWNHLLADETIKISLSIFIPLQDYKDGKNDFGMLKYFSGYKNLIFKNPLVGEQRGL